LQALQEEKNAKDYVSHPNNVGNFPQDERRKVYYSRGCKQRDQNGKSLRVFVLFHLCSQMLLISIM
jgi:hypothetical protein